MRVSLFRVLYAALIICTKISICIGAEQHGPSRRLELPTDYPVLCEAEPAGAGPSSYAPFAESEAASVKAERTCLNTLASVAKRRGSTLILKLDDGKLRKFENKDLASADCVGKECPHYRLLGMLPQPRYYIIREYELELINDLLVPMGQGNVESLAAPIHLSPSAELAVSVSDNNGPSSRDFDIKVLKLSDGGSDVEFMFYNKEAWEFVSVRNDSEVRLRVGEAQVETQHYEATLAKDNFGVWHLSRTKDYGAKKTKE